MGLFGAIRDRIAHRDDFEDTMVDTSDMGAMRSRVLGEPMNDMGNDEFVPNSRYATPAASRFNPVRVHNIGPQEGMGIVGRRADDLMPADRLQSPMFSPAPTQFGEQPSNNPMSIGPSINSSNERILEKIEYLRQDIKMLKDSLDLIGERIKNIQARVEGRGY